MQTMPLSVSQAVISAEAAHACVGAAVKTAQTMGLQVNVAVLDASGVLAAFLRMPGAPLHSVEIAIDKAYTAASFGLATSQWQEVLQGHFRRCVKVLCAGHALWLLAGAWPLWTRASASVPSACRAPAKRRTRRLHRLAWPRSVWLDFDLKKLR